ncbi:MAG: hypothetical protein IPM21_07605 [Acidobacteria bacterium]|nr:hypothetical protein [Acidobacteriota bacterium]
MKLAVIGIVLFALFSTGDSDLRQNESEATSSPSEVVQLYVKAVENGDRVQLAELTTWVPEGYYLAKQLEVELYSRMKGESVSNLRTTEIDCKHSPRLEIPEGNPIRLIDHQVDSMRDNQVYIERILTSWTHFDEARVRVELRSRKFDSYLRKTDFLLTRVDSKWKIFLLESESIVNVYGLTTPFISKNMQN